MMRHLALYLLIGVAQIWAQVSSSGATIPLSELHKSLDQRLDESQQELNSQLSSIPQSSPVDRWTLGATAQGGVLEDPFVNSGRAPWVGSTVYTNYLIIPRIRESSGMSQDSLKLQLDQEIYHRELQTLLFQSAIQYHYAQAKIKQIEQYLNLEASFLEALNARQEQGLILSRDKLAFQASFKQAQRNLNYTQSSLTEAREILEILTGQTLQGTQSIDFDLLQSTPPLRSNPFPELTNKQQLIQTQVTPRPYQLSAGATAGLRKWEAFPNTVLDAAVSLNFTYFPGAHARSQQELKKQKIQSQQMSQQLKMAQQRREIEAKKLLRKLNDRQHALNYGQEYVESLRNSLDQATLRSTDLPGDMIEQQLKAHHLKFNAELEFIQNQEDEKLAFIQLWLDYPEYLNTETKRQTAVAIQSEEPMHQRTALVWDIQSLSHPKLTSVLKSYKITELAVSLTPQQLNSLNSLLYVDSLQKLFNSFEPIQVSLLLGEPSFLDHPEQINPLLNQLQKLSWNRLILDIEASQLKRELSIDSIGQLYTTVIEATKSSTSLDLIYLVHPREVQSTFVREAQQAGLKVIAPMIYHPRVEEVISRWTQLNTQHSTEVLQMGLVVSLESSQEIGSESAWVEQDREKILRDFDSLPSPLLIQSLEHLLELEP